MGAIALETFRPLRDHPYHLGDRNKIHSFRLWNLKLVSLIHADEDGLFQHPYELVIDAVNRSDYIISCFPWMVKRQHSVMRDKIIGDWYGKTYSNIFSVGGKQNSHFFISDKQFPFNEIKNITVTRWI